MELQAARSERRSSSSQSFHRSLEHAIPMLQTGLFFCELSSGLHERASVRERCRHVDMIKYVS